MRLEMTEAERRRRLHQAYEILLATARRKRATADAHDAEEPGTLAEGDTPDNGRDVRREYIPQ